MKISADSLPRHKQSDRVAQLPVRSAYTQVSEEVIQPRTAVEMGVSMRTPKPVNLHRNLDGASHQVAAAAKSVAAGGTPSRSGRQSRPRSRLLPDKIFVHTCFLSPRRKSPNRLAFG